MSDKLSGHPMYTPKDDIRQYFSIRHKSYLHPSPHPTRHPRLDARIYYEFLPHQDSIHNTFLCKQAAMGPLASLPI